MKIAERRKKRQNYEDRQKAKRGEPIDVLHGNPAVVRGYKDLNIKRFFYTIKKKNYKKALNSFADEGM